MKVLTVLKKIISLINNNKKLSLNKFNICKMLYNNLDSQLIVNRASMTKDSLNFKTNSIIILRFPNLLLTCREDMLYKTNNYQLSKSNS